MLRAKDSMQREVGLFLLSLDRLNGRAILLCDVGIERIPNPLYWGWMATISRSRSRFWPFLESVSRRTTQDSIGHF